MVVCRDTSITIDVLGRSTILAVAGWRRASFTTVWVTVSFVDLGSERTRVLLSKLWRWFIVTTLWLWLIVAVLSFSDDIVVRVAIIGN